MSMKYAVSPPTAGRAPGTGWQLHKNARSVAGAALLARGSPCPADAVPAGGSNGNSGGCYFFHFSSIIRYYFYGRKFPTYIFLNRNSHRTSFQNSILTESNTPPETAGIVSIICLHGKPTYTYKSLTHQTLFQIVGTLYLKGLGQHVSEPTVFPVS